MYPPNCAGFGRVRHFYRYTNSLPIDPAQKALGVGKTDLLRAQVFQLSACNWRCWYCFVDFPLLSADPNHASWLTTDELVKLYADQHDRPQVIDLTGGQPDLAPEWIPWMMRSLKGFGLDKSTYLWSDDNLSTDFFWRYLNEDDLELISSYHNYGRVGCFKGFDEVSFSYNTSAAPELFDQQFILIKRLVYLGLDQYCYTTFTTPDIHIIKDKMARFVDRLQNIDPMLPLKTIPLEVKGFYANSKRLAKTPSDIIENQYVAIDAWREELDRRYNNEQLSMNIADVRLKKQS